MSDNQQPLLTIDKLSVYFPSDKTQGQVLKNVNLIVNPQECVAVVGESGSGKSLTALSVMQLLPESARVSADSHIFFNGQDLLCCAEKNMRQIRGRKISMIFQDAMSAFNPVMTIGEQMRESARAYPLPSNKKSKQAMLDLLAEVGINDVDRYYGSYPHQLSGGQRQRAMIAMALIGEPSLLIADEPTTSLDVTLQATIMQLLKKLQTTRHMAILFISHDLSIVKHMADRVILMKQGSVVEETNKDQFFIKPTTDYGQNLLLAIPTLTPQVEKDKKPAETILTISDVSVIYGNKQRWFSKKTGVRAVNHVSLDLQQGKTLALVGESGSGKTSLAKAIVRLNALSTGDIYINDYSLKEISYRQKKQFRQDVQYVFQDPFSAMNPRMLVHDILSEGVCAQNSINKKDLNQKINEVLSWVKLSPSCQYRYPHEFSGGERQRICIARALMLSPKLLILDEPTSALDVSIQKKVLDLLIDLQKNLGLAYFLITHNFSVVAKMADDVAVMHQGAIVEYGQVHSVLTEPQHHYTQKLLAAVPT